MKALLKNGKTVEIDTQFLSTNQYNTVDGERIFDENIERIFDDVRVGLGKCRYCGEIVRRGEEDKHFASRESRSCEGCFYRHNTVTDRRVQTTEENGVRTRVITETLAPYCAYNKTVGGESTCTNTECRRRGIEWFTAENTPFIAHPDGFPAYKSIGRLEEAGFDVDNALLDAEYCKKIGSYRLYANLVYKNGRPVGFSGFRISNARRWYTFRIESDGIYSTKYSFGWHKVRTLEGIPSGVMHDVLAIVQEVIA